MKEKPILFSGLMVRAILAGKKTQTRRIVKLRDPSQTYSTFDDDGWPTTANENGQWHKDPCPYGAPGTRLWVRETWEQVEHIGGHGEPLNNSCRYRADHDHALGRWRSPIHMPRWASRLTLEITDIRVERLQEISEVGAINEGILSVRSPEWDRQHFPTWRAEFNAACAANRKPPIGPSPARAFKALWESINGKGSWDLNPWVWVIGFKTVDGVK